MRMKEVKFLFAVLVVLFLAEGVNADQIFSDGFEDGSITDWTITNGANGGWYLSTGEDPGPIGTYDLIARDSITETTAIKSVSTLGYQNIYFNFWWSTDTNLFESGDYFYADWYDGTSWINTFGFTSGSQTSYIFRQNSLSSASNNNPNLKIRFRCNSNQGTEGCNVDNITITGEIIPDTTPPAFSNYIESPLNNSAYVAGQIYRFNVTITEASGVQRAGIEFNGTNYSVSNLSNVYMFNISNLAAGTYSYYWWANDTLGNYNTSGMKYYTIAKTNGGVSFLLNGNADNLTIQYPQQSNVSASTLYGNVVIYLDGADITSQNGANVTRGGGYYNITAVSSGDENHTYKSVTYWLNVTKAVGSVSLVLNGAAGDLTVQYPQSVNAFASTSYGSASLYRDGVDKSSENGDFVLLNVGYYNYTAVSSGNQNYSSSSVTYFANVTKGFISVSLLLNGNAENKTLVYLNNLNATASATAGTVHLYRGNVDVTSENGVNVLLGVGFYEYKANATGNSNYFDNSSGVVYYANITKANPSVAMQININPSTNENYGTQTRAIATEGVTGDSDLSYSLYRGGTLVASSSPWEEPWQTLNAGNYNYIFNTTGGANYTEGSVNLTLTINKISNPMSLLLNGNANNLTIQYPQQVNATAGSASGIFKLFRNGTDVTSENGNNVTLPAGYYEYFANSTGGTSYLPNSTGLKFYVNVTSAPDITAPVVTIVLPGEGQTFGFNESLPLNFSVIEDNLDSCWYFIDDGVNVSLPDCLNSTFNTTSGSHIIKVFANDSSGNVGFDENNFSVSLGAPSILLLSPNENAYKHSEVGIYGFIYQPEDPNLDSCELWGDFNGTFMRNETDSSLISGSPNLFSVSLGDGDYLWAVYCNDTFGNSAFTANRTLHIDNIVPNLTLTQPSGEKSSRSVGLTFSVADRNPMNCWYNVYQGASLELANTTTNCTIGQDSFTVSADASYLLNFFAEDYAGNLNYTNSTFSVSTSVAQPPSSSSGGGGGGGGGIATNLTGAPNLEIKNVSEIFIEHGTSRALNLEVFNNGKRFLNNCYLTFRGSAGSWFNNGQRKGFALGEKFVFDMALDVPVSSEPGDYLAEIVIKCEEYEKTKILKLKVHRNSFEAEINDYERVGNNLKVKYLLREYGGVEHAINIDYYLLDLDNLTRYSGKESISFSPLEESERTLQFDLPKDSFGEFTFKMEFDDGKTKVTSIKEIFLPSETGFTGLAISDDNRNVLIGLGIIVGSTVILYFVFRFGKRRYLRARYGSSFYQSFKQMHKRTSVF